MWPFNKQVTNVTVTDVGKPFANLFSGMIHDQVILNSQVNDYKRALDVAKFALIKIQEDVNVVGDSYGHVAGALDKINLLVGDLDG